MNSFALHAIKENFLAIILIAFTHGIILLRVCPSRLRAK